MGRILGAHGVKGALRIQSFSDPPEGLLDFSTWWLQQASAPARIVRVLRGQGSTKGLIVELEGLADRDAAAALAGAEILVERVHMPRLPSGQYYWTDLEGLRVINQDGIDFGVVDHLFDNGAHAVMLARSAERERLIPFVLGNFVKAVDLDQRLITVEWDADF